MQLYEPNGHSVYQRHLGVAANYIIRRKTRRRVREGGRGLDARTSSSREFAHRATHSPKYASRDFKWRAEPSVSVARRHFSRFEIRRGRDGGDASRVPHGGARTTAAGSERGSRLPSRSNAAREPYVARGSLDEEGNARYGTALFGITCARPGFPRRDSSPFARTAASPDGVFPRVHEQRRVRHTARALLTKTAAHLLSVRALGLSYATATSP